MPDGYLAMVLHAHLPYIRPCRREQCLEERWLHEAVTETYIPLYMSLSRLAADGVRYRLTLSVSPPLATMLMDGHFKEAYSHHIDSLVELAEREVHRTAFSHDLNDCAHMYLDRFRRVRDVFNHELGRDVVSGFRRLADHGVLEIITTGATHGYLPLMSVCREAARAQVRVAVAFHESAFGHKPKGFWLPECGYSSPDDALLKEAGIRYFFTDSHGVANASPRPRYGVFAPIFTRSGVAAFARDMESSKQVWSAKEGYPGDFDYREFYRDIGYELDLDYICHYLPASATRCHTGIKYYRITGRTDQKEPYVRSWAMEKAAIHAGNFMFNREKQVQYLCRVMDRRPIVVAPYDAELFGHWWFEGPEWLDFLIRKIAYDQNTLEMITPSDYLDIYPRNQVSTPSMSSWGYKGYSEVWLSHENSWIYRHLHMMAKRMVELAQAYPEPQPEHRRRALNQAARELLLAQSSDWAFIMKAGTCVDYAIRRMNEHTSAFNTLYDQIKRDRLDMQALTALEQEDRIFPDIHYSVYGHADAQAQVAGA